MVGLNVNTIADEAGTGGPDFVAMPSVGGSPIVESGSNSDGEWTRWADGTQIGTGEIIGGSSGPAAGSFDVPWTFPVPFVSSAYASSAVHVSQGGIPPEQRGGGFESIRVSGLQTTLRYFTPGSIAESITDLRLVVTTIGRWK